MRDKVELAVACGLCGFLLFWYILFFVLFVKSAGTQMVKSKSPKLLLMSTIGNFTSFLVISATIILVTLKNEPHFQERTMNSSDAIKEMDKIANIGLILSEIIFAPLMFYSHMFRIIQLKNIFEITDDISKAATTKSKWFRQGIYFIFDLLLFAATVVFGSFLISHEFLLCPISPEWLNIILMTLSFILIFLVSIFGVSLISNVKYLTEVRAELTSLVAIWTISNAMSSYLSIEFETDTDRRLLTVSIPLIILLVRNMVSFIIVLVIPLLNTSKEKVIPFGETRESANSLNMILASELSFKYFFDFIDMLDTANGSKLTALYIEIKLYEEAIADMMNVRLAREKVKGIIKDFLTENGKNWISDIPIKVKEDIKEKFEANGPDTRLFNDLYNHIEATLQKYFEAFQKAESYKKLIKELEYNEILYGRLVNADLI